MSADDSATVRIDIKKHLCPKCETQNLEHEVIANQYRCVKCGYELAHLDLTPTGGVRGVFGWMKEAGEVIAERYRIRTVLGRGGFGATYLVEDQRVNGKRWALKEIPEMLFDEFEVSLLSHLDHPAIPIIVDRFTSDGMVYLVLKFGGNRTLQSECRSQQRIPYPRLKPWALQLGDVLRYLHNLTPPVIHRDLKPENVLLDDADRVMLIDFGIAKESLPASMTRTLGRAASHGYSPPEQVLGTGTDQRSDIYSFAATLYFALTGQTPAAAHERVAGKALLPPADSAPELPATVNAILLKALSLNINERPQRIEDVLAVLQTGRAELAGEIDMTGKTVAIGSLSFGPMSHTAGVSSVPLESARSAAASGQGKKLAWLGGSVAALLLIAGGVYWSQRAEETPPAPSASSATLSPPPAAVSGEPATPQAQTVALPAAVTAPQPAVPGGSALEILNSRRVVEPEPAPAASRRTESSIETAISNRPARSTASAPQRRAKEEQPPTSSQSGSGSSSGWSIVPGQTQKIR
jgi:serine/threonine-protein kinase